MLKRSSFHALAALLFAAAPAWAINKCTQKDGKVVYQDAACETSARGESVRVFAGEGVAAPVPAPAPAAKPARKSEQREEREGDGAASLGPTTPTASEIDKLAAACLDWYRPRLKNPAGAYYGDASLSKGVLSLTIYGSNSFGGYVPKAAACEFKGGSLDAGWTRIQAERSGWR